MHKPPQRSQGASRDRVQSVKRWLNAGRTTSEDTLDLGASDDRNPDLIGRTPPVRNTMGSATATCTSDTGVPIFAALWKDHDYDPSWNAFCDMRVIKTPALCWRSVFR